ncbi:MAG TPA: 50S ribosomal protein L18 [Candidatus Cloacimonetes bacterium]|nr:50S ribosomal protein L18 [Candidatus Cloacimonadota bacterium]
MDNNAVTLKKYLARRKRRKSIRKKIFGSSERPRLSVFRSLKNISAQIINDDLGNTLVMMSSNSKEIKLDRSKKKVEQSFEVGLKLGEKAIALGISEVSFDRGGYLYHGRVKALADGARKAGLKF